MELVRMGGTSSGDTTAVASTRPSVSKVSAVSMPSTRRPAASKVASASAVDNIGGREAAGVVDIVGECGLTVKWVALKGAPPEALHVAGRERQPFGCLPPR